jgi:hypothetical protein
MNQITNLYQSQNKVIVSMGYDNIETNITLAPGHGAILPDPSVVGPYSLVWWNASDYIISTDDPFVEVVSCIVKIGDTLIVMRSQQQTLASYKNIPGKLYNMIPLPGDNLEILSYYNVPQVHGSASHTGIIGDHTVNISNVGSNTHAAIDTAIGTTLPGLVTTHAGLTTAHGSTSAATVSAIMQRDAAGRAKVVAPSATDDIAIKSTVDSHAGEEASTFLSFTEVDPGSTITVTASKVNVVAETNGASRVYKTLSRTLTDFSFNFELYFTAFTGDSSGESDAAVVLLGDSTDQIAWSTWGSNNGVGAFLQTNSSNIPKISTVKYVSGSGTRGTNITLALATQYYCTLSRSSTILTVSVFSDAARTTHISGSPQTQTVVTTAWDKLHVCNNSITYLYTHTYYIQNLTGYSVHDLGTMSTQNANNVTITGGSITNISLLQSAGSFSLPIVNKTGAYTATANDHTITCNATSATFTITLPTAVGISGRIYVIKKIDSSGNAITVDANASETIDGTLTKSLNFQYESITIQSDGTNWYIL